MIFGSPKLSFGTPKIVFGSPKLSFGSPKMIFGSPKLSFGSPKIVFRSPKMSLGLLKAVRSIDGVSHLIGLERMVFGAVISFLSIFQA
jgi:hypothetical protein